MPLAADANTLTAANVRIAITGGVYNAAVGTTLPTLATTALDAAFTARELGYLSDAGIVQSIATSTTNITAWQNADVVRKVQTEQDVTYKFDLLETSALTLETYYGNYTGTTAQGVSQITGALMPHFSWIFHVIDGDARIRLVLPDAQVTDRGDTSMVNGAALVYPLTLTAYPDTSGVKAYAYLDSDVSA